MNTQAVSGRLICRSGELAGSKFELGADNRIGMDESGHLAVKTDGSAVAMEHARIYARNGEFYLESGSTGAVSIDGTAISGAVCLARMHVIGLPGNIDFVFTRTATAAPAAVPVSVAPTATPPTPTPAPSAPLAPAPAAPQPEAGGTVVDMMAWDALPDLAKPQPAEPKPPEPKPPELKPSVDAGGTVVDMMGMSMLPELNRPAAAPAPAPAPPAAPPAAPPRPSNAEAATEVVPRQERRLEVTVNLPGIGATKFPLKRGDNVVGRGEGCDIMVTDPEMWLSRKHAIIRVLDDRIELVDLKGANGTFVQGKRIETATLQPGSSFVLGPHFEFKIQES